MNNAHGFEFLDYEDEQQPNSAISTATPPAVVGNRFFGPDFNIEQVKGTCKWFMVEIPRNRTNNSYCAVVITYNSPM